MGVVTKALGRRETYTGALREAIGLAECVARYPLGVLEAGRLAFQSGADPCHNTPVVLVHGWGHNRSGWFVVQRHLRAAGFGNVVTLNYNPVVFDVPALADRLAHRVESVRKLTGAPRVHVVGHSLGGIILRWYVQEAGGVDTVDTAVTVASPHEGTVLAHLAPGRTMHEIRPGSWLLRRLADGARPSPVRWVAYYSNIDVLVQPARSAMLRHPALAAENVLVKDTGHLSIMLSNRLARSMVEHLELIEVA
jgi:triacylglycerol lipase